jgi:hypothetical protein
MNVNVTLEILSNHSFETIYTFQEWSKDCWIKAKTAWHEEGFLSKAEACFWVVAGRVSALCSVIFQVPIVPLQTLKKIFQIVIYYKDTRLPRGSYWKWVAKTISLLAQNVFIHCGAFTLGLTIPEIAFGNKKVHRSAFRTALKLQALFTVPPSVDLPHEGEDLRREIVRRVIIRAGENKQHMFKTDDFFQHIWAPSVVDAFRSHHRENDLGFEYAVAAIDLPPPLPLPNIPEVHENNELENLPVLKDFHQKLRGSVQRVSEWAFESGFYQREEIESLSKKAKVAIENCSILEALSLFYCDGENIVDRRSGLMLEEKNAGALSGQAPLIRRILKLFDEMKGEEGGREERALPFFLCKENDQAKRIGEEISPRTPRIDECCQLIETFRTEFVDRFSLNERSPFKIGEDLSGLFRLQLQPA